MAFYDLEPEMKTILETREWVAGYSGGKDSTSMVSYIEWLRRTKQIAVSHPKLVIADTGVEFPFLMEIANEFISALEKTGWTARRVTPKRKDKLYTNIFGRGMTPVNPGFKRLRWCTANTKVFPMRRYRKHLGKDIVALTAVRWGESAVRDKKIQATCSAGGECGVVPTSAKENVYGPIINWTLCQVYDWLQGIVGTSIKKVMPDLFPIMKRLVHVYNFRKESDRLELPMLEPEVNSLRFGCIGCPAIANDKALTRAIQENAEWKYLESIHYIWDQLRLPYNRCSRIKNGKLEYGPIKMAARKKWFYKMLEIQVKSGVQLMDKEDVEFIFHCWEAGEYPRGWSEENEKEIDREDGMM